MAVQVSGWVSFWGAKAQGKFFNASLSSSRKDERAVGGKGYANTSWGEYCAFVGRAADKMTELLRRLEDAQTGGNDRPVRIKLTEANMKREKYEDADGEVKTPKWAQITVFDFEFDEGRPANPVAPPDDDDIPF